MAPTAEQLTQFLEKRGFAGVLVAPSGIGYAILPAREEDIDPMLELLSTIGEPGPFDVWSAPPGPPPPRWQFWHYLPWGIKIERRLDG